MGVFEETAPALDSRWRAIILFGRNVGSYKFALGQSLLDLGSLDRRFISMEDLAEPFAKHIVRHLELAPKQATSASSRFRPGISRSRELSLCRLRSPGSSAQRSFLASSKGRSRCRRSGRRPI